MVLRGEPLEIVTTDPAALPSPRASAARMSARVGQVLSRKVSRSCSSLMVSKGSGWGAPPTVLTMQVDATERLHGPIGEQRDGRFGVHRPGDAHDVEPLGAEGRLGRRHPVLVAAVDHDRGALAGQAEGARSADARIGGRTGHDGDPTGEPLVRTCGRGITSACGIPVGWPTLASCPTASPACQVIRCASEPGSAQSG